MWCWKLLSMAGIIICTFYRVTVQASESQKQDNEYFYKIKDLICVLLLSEMHKQGLDMNAVNEMRRNNVNNDTTWNSREKCLWNATLFPSQVIKLSEINNTNKTSIDHTYTQPIPKLLKTNKHVTDLDLNVQEGIPKNNINHILPSNPSLIKDIIKHRVKTDGEPIIKVVGTQKNTIKGYNTKRDTDQANPGELLKAFNLFDMSNPHEVTSSYSKTTFPTSLADIQNTRDKQPKDEANNEYNLKQFGQLFLDLLSKTSKSTLTTPTTTEMINIDSISKQIERFLNIKSKSYSDRGEFKNINRYNEDDEIIKNDTLKYLNNLVHSDVSLRNGLSSRLNETEETTKTSSLYSPKFKEINDWKVNSKTKIINKDDIKKLITHDWIKEIAEEVKALVLKDFHYQVQTIKTTTSTTTETLNKNNHLTENIEDMSKIMQKIMKLFKELEAIKTRFQIPISSTTQPNLNQIVTHQAHNITMKVLIPPIISLTNPYGANHIPHQIVPIFVNQLNGATSHPLFVDKITGNIVTRYNEFNGNFRNRVPAITIQTNSNEMPPLGIPIPKIINPINQNIIITSENVFTAHNGILYGFKSHNNDRDYKKENNHDENYYDLTKKLRNFGINNEYRIVDKDDYKIKSHDKDIPFNMSIMSSFRSLDKSNLGYDFDTNNSNSSKFKTHKVAGEERGRIHNENIKNFHKKLEDSDNWKESSTVNTENGDCCKITNRQQRPVQREKYDDTYFQNFLKTQQKVNDMLERILAMKNVSSGQESVEVT